MVANTVRPCPVGYIFTGSLKVCQIAVIWMVFVSAQCVHSSVAC